MFKHAHLQQVHVQMEEGALKNCTVCIQRLIHWQPTTTVRNYKDRIHPLIHHTCNLWFAKPLISKIKPYLSNTTSIPTQVPTC